METQLIYLLGTLLVVDLIVLIAWAVPSIAGMKIGYRWRKMLWLILAVRLLIPLRFLMSGIYEKKPSSFWQIELSLESAADAPQDDVPVKTQQAIGEAKNDALVESLESSENTKHNANINKSERYEKAKNDALVEALESVENTKQDTDIKEPEWDEKAKNNADADRSDWTENVRRDASANTRNLLVSLYHHKWLFLALWIAGAVVLTEYHLIGFLNIREWFRRYSRHCTDEQLCAKLAAVCDAYCVKTVPQIFICGNISSPMLLGYRHTILLMPDSPYTEAELTVIFCHEMQHKKSGDLWYKLLLMFVCDLYWFNPVMWLMKKLAYQDVECVCDTLVMRRLSTEEQKTYGMTVLKNMAKNRVRDIVYGTSIFTGKRAARRRLENMYTIKNRWGYLVLGTLAAAGLAGSSMWVFAGQIKNESDTLRNVLEAGVYANQQIRAALEGAQSVQQEKNAAMPVFRVEDMDILHWKGAFELADYYITNKVVVDNRYYIDENKVLWGAGRNEYGQLGIEDTNTEDFYQTPVKIAEHVVTVDCSENGYFCVYLTEDGCLYGLGNMLGLLGTEQTGAAPALLLENVAYVRAGRECIVALDRDQNVWWWGQYCGTYHTRAYDSRDYEKSVEDDTNPAKMLYTRPRKILENCIYVTTGSVTGAAISAEGSLYTWGRNLLGECGTPVTDDEFVRTPQKVLDDVRMVWVEEIAGNSKAQEIARIGRYDTNYHFNLFAQRTDGTIVGVGKDLGAQERIIHVTGDLEKTSVQVYSDTFVPVALEVYDALQIKKRLKGLTWGMDALSVKDFLTRNRVRYEEVYDAYDEYGNSTMYPKRYDENYTIVAEDNRYHFTFDEKGCLDGILIQEGDKGRNGQFHAGTSMEEVWAE
ncbi:MAG: hypothetical protein HFH78_00155 [Lachnospiraceae bacterium]|nr:hypothetical protein [Lachnospiraceae bacterium]